MLSKAELKKLTVENLDEIMGALNDALEGIGLDRLEETITRLGRGGKLPHWFEGLKDNGRLPNFDGKTVGSILEMVFVAVVEQKIKVELGHDIAPLKINPARGVDLPDLDLGIKSPSTNFCTSEPFFSAYERLLGSDYDALVLLTDYQEAKKKSLLNLQITDWKYLQQTEIADAKLCRLARKHRDWLMGDDEQRAKRLFRFLAYVNKIDWRASRLLKLVDDLNDEKAIRNHISVAIKDFEKENKKRDKKGSVPLPDSERIALEKILSVQPLYIGVIEAVDNWVVEVMKDAARAPSENEWQRLRAGPLNGKIGMSFALQWRYDFASIFNGSREAESDVQTPGERDLDANCA